MTNKLFYVLLIFLYIFSFYIVGFFNSSMLVAFILLPCLLKKSYVNILINALKSKYVYTIFCFQFSLILTGVLYSILTQTYDFSYVKIFFAQILHIFIGVLLVSYFRYTKVIEIENIEKYIIYAYVIQSVIELIASIFPPVADVIIKINRSDFAEKVEGVRGLALSGAVGWSLSLTYGLVFIIYAKHYLMNRIKWNCLLILLMLFVGNFFAGRTGFIGLIFALTLFILANRNSVWSRMSMVVKLSFLIVMICGIIYIAVPAYVDYMLERVFPFAFEPIYNYLDGKGFTTTSTDILDDMWNINVSMETLLKGTGYFTGIDGSYYMHTDVGILRNLLYWGLFGYSLVICYQFYIIYPILKNHIKIDKNYVYAMFFLFYLCVTEYKAMVLGSNKAIISITFLLGYFYYLRNKEYKRVCLK